MDIDQIRNADPNAKAQWGPVVWQTFHSLAEAIPCEGCRQVAIRVLHGFHDAVNIELGKPVRHPEDLAYATGFLANALRNCKGSNCRGPWKCNVHTGCKRS